MTGKGGEVGVDNGESRSGEFDATPFRVNAPTFSARRAPRNSPRSGQVRAEVDRGKYPKGVQVSDQEFASLRIKRDKFHGEWNYTLLPRSQ